MNNIGEKIKKFRKEKGLTQQQFADILGKSKSLIQKYESNSTNVPTDVLFDIAMILNVKIHHLLYEEESVSYKEYEYEEKLNILMEDGSNIIKNRILELNNGVDNDIFINQIYALLEALDIDFTYDKGNNLLYIGECYTKHISNNSCGTRITNIDNFLLMIKNILSIRNNFIEISEISERDMEQINKDLVILSDFNKEGVKNGK